MSDIALPSLDELTASVEDWIADHEAGAWSDGVSSLVGDIARDVPR